MNFATMNNESIIAKFAEEAKVDAKLAKRIVDKLSENELPVERMNSVIRRLKDFFVKNEYWSFLSRLKDDTIQKVIDEMIADEMRRQSEREVSCSETSMRLFNEFNEEWKEYKAGDEVKIQIMRTGERNHPSYWKVTVTKDTIKDVIKNFKNRERWIDIAVDENHEWNHRSLARFKDVYQEWKDAAYALLKLTKKGAELLTEWAYKYFSPEIVFQKKDEETWKIQKNLLLWGAFTNRPFFKNMQPLFATEAAESESSQFQSSSVFLFNNHWPMKTLIQLLAKFTDTQAISKDEQETIKNLFSELDSSEQEQFKQHVDEALAFAYEESDEDKGEDKAAEDEEDKGEDAADDTAELPVVKANEQGLYTFSEEEMTVFKNIISKSTKVVAEARKAKVSDKVNSLAFSEKTKKGFILPNSVDEVVKFALSLNEAQSDKFFDILWKFKVLSAGEIWHSQSKDTVSTEDAEKIKFFKEKMWLDDEEAKQALQFASK
jgi:hypothetical protein